VAGESKREMWKCKDNNTSLCKNHWRVNGKYGTAMKEKESFIKED
jgi:hypothetical protein